ncbi:hypothetical protein Tco_1124684 [Tanacetum coccineum]|uniref:Retrotransposon gag domain-containing protein n=1 Tax=Tanacetum coccineum TaxID=301880 RepID=A0ABQ5J772_9ASTR
MADTRTMSELLQAPTEGYRDTIVIPAILVENFELKVRLLTLVTSSQFHGFERDDPHSHIRWLNKITSTLKYQNITNLKNDITNFQQRFDASFGDAWDRFKDLFRKCPHHGFSELHQIDTFYNALTQSDQDSLNAAAGGNLLNRTPRDALTIIENKSKVRISRNKPIVSKVSTTTSSPSPSSDVTAFIEIIKELVLMNKATQQATVKAIDETCVDFVVDTSYLRCLCHRWQHFLCLCSRRDLQSRRQSPSDSGSFPSDTVANPRGDVKAITTRSGVAYEGPSIPPTSSSLPKEVERELEVTRDKVQTTSSESTADVHPPVVRDPIPEPEVVPKPNLKPSIPYPSRLNNQKLQKKTNNQMMKFLQIFQRLHFDISFADSLLHMSKFASTFKSLLSNKEKLFELACTLLNEKCSAVLLKKLPEKLGDPSKFLIPCDFLELVECLALADLGASINLMPLSVWKKLSLSELTPTFDYDVDPRVPLILGRPFLRTARALIDVHGEELTLRVNDEAITFKVERTLRYSCNYYDESVNQINVIDVAYEEYAQEVLEFSDSSTSGNPTPSDPIIASSLPSFTPFEGEDFILEEIETFLHTPDKPSNLDDDYYDTEGDILYLDKLLNEDPSPNLT